MEKLEIRAVNRYVRIATSKGMDFSRCIQGKSYRDALAIAEISPRKAARHFLKTLKCAASIAEAQGENPDDLVVVKAVADPGPTLKRFRPKARGMAGRIHKRSSHLTVVLGKI